MKIVTINTKDSDLDFLITVDNFSSRDRIAFMTISKDKIVLDKVISKLTEMWNIKHFDKYTDHAGVILIETEGR